jgi:hypothetical protein
MLCTWSLAKVGAEENVDLIALSIDNANIIHFYFLICCHSLNLNLIASTLYDCGVLHSFISSIFLD